MNLKKKIIAGILTGAFVMGSGLFSYTAEAAEVDNPPRPIGEHRMQKDGQRPHKPFDKEEAAKHIAKAAKLDESKVKEFLNEKYRPFDIVWAGILADKSGKNVKDVMKMRKINNTWKDVSKTLGINFNELKKDFKGFHHKPRHKRPDAANNNNAK